MLVDVLGVLVLVVLAVGLLLTPADPGWSDEEF